MPRVPDRHLVIRDAAPEEAGWLTALAIRSKAHWGYSAEFMDACRDELTVDPRRIGRGDFHCVLAESGQSIIGYYALQRLSDDEYELDALFVEPDYIGHGVGRSLIQNAKIRLKQIGTKRLTIQGDPNATAFYIAAGGHQVGERASGSIAGRVLPLFQIDLFEPFDATDFPSK